MDYWIDRDWGAAIINTGVVICNNCTFQKNYAKNGGAIFNQGLLIIENCTFIDNDAYGKGDNICIGDGGLVMVNGQNVTKNTDIVYFAKSMSLMVGTILSFATVSLSFLAGFAVGFFTANPVVGALAGAAVGAALGSVAAAFIISQHYDVNYDRLKTALILIGGSAAAGAFGGYLGEHFGVWYHSIINFENASFDCVVPVYGGITLAVGVLGGLTYCVAS